MEYILKYLWDLLFPSLTNWSNTDLALDYDTYSDPDSDTYSDPDSDIYVSLNPYDDIDLTDPQHFFTYG